MELCRYITSEQTRRKVLPIKTRDPTYQTDGAHGALCADRYYWVCVCVCARTHTQTAQKPILEIGLKRLHCPSQAVSILSGRSPFPLCPQTHKQSLHEDVCSTSCSYVDIPCPFVPVMATSLERRRRRKKKGTGAVALTELSCWEKAAVSAFTPFVCNSWFCLQFISLYNTKCHRVL